MFWASLIILLATTQTRSSDEGSFLTDFGGELREASSVDSEQRMRLYQLDPVERNHEQELKLQSGQVLRIRTLGSEPPLFEIPGFLSAEECDHIKQLAMEMGLFRSTLKQDREDDEMEEDASTHEMFLNIDANEDEVLDVHEILEALDLEVNAFFRAEDALQMLQDLSLDHNKDGVLSLEEFSAIDKAKMTQIKEWTKERSKDKTKLNRVSQQTWLSQDDGDKVLADLRQRTKELTRLPEGIIEHSEKLQVVYYEPGGHFHAHYDSEELDLHKRCSHTLGLIPEESMQSEGFSSRLCRYITILYYLDDTLEGGETAFPVADNETFSEKALGTDTYDLSHHCHDANLYVKPEKGKAVMWYNHYINDTTGWLGPMNPYSLHGGCDVKLGTKWIANNWITVDDSYRRQVLFMKAQDSRTNQAVGSHHDDSKKDASEDDSYPGKTDFVGTVDSLKQIWKDYIQSHVGAKTIQSVFLGEPSLQRMTDIMFEFAVNNVAEIWVLRHNEERYVYKINWLDKSDWRYHSNEVTTDFVDFILMASGKWESKKTLNGNGLTGAEVSVLKNPRASKSDNSETISDSIQDSGFENSKDEL